MTAPEVENIERVLPILDEMVGLGVLVVQAAGEGGIGQHQGVGLRVVGVVLRQRVAVADVRVLDAVQQHVHAADAQHRVVEVEAMEHAAVEMFAQLRVMQQGRAPFAQVFAGRHEET